MSKPCRCSREIYAQTPLGRPRPSVIWRAHFPGDIVRSHDLFSPTPSSQSGARLKLSSSVVVAIRSEGTQPVRAKLHELSVTGGLLGVSKAFEHGDSVEVAFQTSMGTVHGMAELLAARRESSSGCLQPFRFVALDDDDHTRLRMALDSLLDRTVVAVRSSKPPSL
jgi:hypothetical protein